MVARNDPCPCGSGKKYKKCCLPKDREARAQDAAASDNEVFAGEINAAEEEMEAAPLSDFNVNVGTDSPPPLTMVEVDPLLQRINAFWEDFMDAPYEKQWNLTTKLLAEEPDLLDGEMVFEITNTLSEQAIEAGETERYKQLLLQLEEKAAEAYAEELHYILEHLIEIALIEEDEDSLAQAFLKLSTVAGEQLDSYYRMISLLAYHGKLDILYEGMRQARPYVAEGAEVGGLFERAYSEFTEKLGDIELLHLLDENPDLTADDPTLQQRFAEYELTVVPEMFSTALDYRSGRELPAWTLADFHFSKRTKKDPTKDRFDLLVAAFTHYAQAEEGISRTKAAMASEDLRRYVMMRLSGELSTSTPQSGKKRSSKKSSTSQLYPDAQTLDSYLSQRMGFLSFHYLEALALFELIPAWLRFLAKYDLLDEKTRRQIIQSLSYIKGHLLQFARNQLSDQSIPDNLAEWPYEPEEN